MSPEPVRIPSGDTDLAADLYRPHRGGRGATVLMAPGFGAIRRAGLPPFAERFRDQGFGVVLFDYRHFGESGGEPRQLLSIGRQIEDWHAALRFTRELPEFDSRRIALWGTSFSGGHVVRVAAEDGGVAAVVSQVPFASGIPTVLALPPLSALKVTAAAVADGVRSALGGAPVTVSTVGRPGEAAAIPLDEAVDGFRRLHEGLEWENRVCARIGPATLFYRPLRYAGRVRCPLLVQVGERDALTPPSPARRMAGKAPRGELRTHPVGHFDAYFGEAFGVFVGEQVAFLDRHLGAREPEGEVGKKPDVPG